MKINDHGSEKVQEDASSRITLPIFPMETYSYDDPNITAIPPTTTAVTALEQHHIETTIPHHQPIMETYTHSFVPLGAAQPSSPRLTAAAAPTDTHTHSFSATMMPTGIDDSIVIGKIPTPIIPMEVLSMNNPTTADVMAVITQPPPPLATVVNSAIVTQEGFEETTSSILQSDKIFEDNDTKARDFSALIPQIKSYSRDLVPGINIYPSERVALLRKGGTIRLDDFSRGGAIPKWTPGLVWDVTNGKNIDLDASVICLDSELGLIDIIYYKKLKSSDGAIIRGDDEREGDARGDDKKIRLCLDEVNKTVSYIGFVINS